VCVRAQHISIDAKCKTCTCGLLDEQVSKLFFLRFMEGGPNLWLSVLANEDQTAWGCKRTCISTSWLEMANPRTALPNFLIDYTSLDLSSLHELGISTLHSCRNLILERFEREESASNSPLWSMVGIHYLCVQWNFRRWNFKSCLRSFFPVRFTAAVFCT